MNQTQKQHIESRIDVKINAKMQEFDESNPKPEGLKSWQLLEVATKDPQWLKNIVKQSRNRNSWDCDNQILRDSPKAKAFAQKYNLASDKIQKERAALLKKLNQKRDCLMDSFMLAGLEGKEIIAQIEAF